MDEIPVLRFDTLLCHGTTIHHTLHPVILPTPRQGAQIGKLMTATLGPPDQTMYQQQTDRDIKRSLFDGICRIDSTTSLSKWYSGTSCRLGRSGLEDNDK